MAKSKERFCDNLITFKAETTTKNIAEPYKKIDDEYEVTTLFINHEYKPNYENLNVIREKTYHGVKTSDGIRYVITDYSLKNKKSCFYFETGEKSFKIYKETENNFVDIIANGETNCYSFPIIATKIGPELFIATNNPMQKNNTLNYVNVHDSTYSTTGNFNILKIDLKNKEHKVIKQVNNLYNRYGIGILSNKQGEPNIVYFTPANINEEKPTTFTSLFKDLSGKSKKSLDKEVKKSLISINLINNETKNLFDTKNYKELGINKVNSPEKSQSIIFNFK